MFCLMEKRNVNYTVYEYISFGFDIVWLFIHIRYKHGVWKEVCMCMKEVS